MPDGLRPARFGAATEAAAVAFLGRLGYRIVRRNLRGPGGEIDVVALDGDVVVFVEVKARASDGFGSAVSAVDRRKRERIRSVAGDFLQFFAPDAKARFDVVTYERGRFRLIRDAFR